MLPDGDEAASVSAANDKYKERLERTKTASDSFSQRAAQTLNDSRKDKETQASAVKSVDSSTQFNAHELHDTMQAVQRDPAIKQETITSLVQVSFSFPLLCIV